ncbi:hypothetical protein ACOI1C_10125 [Bacillus sp. DJP31]|uniref:hypothetical protein n=1 Tax=Bacillus sp. DJP31 TaxID=3409789 RepID=UPI003BB6AD07
MLVLENDSPSEIMLSRPNKESLILILSHGLNPIIVSLFGTYSNKEYQWKPQESYRVLPEFIEKYEDEEFDKVLSFFKIMSNGPIFSISLSTWRLEDSLKNSLAIRYFTHQCKNVYLWVDYSEKITTLQVVL